MSERGEAYSAEIRWYSPFLQNEFIRGVRDSHCWDSRFLCDKGLGRRIGGEKKGFISCSSEAAAVSGDQLSGWIEENWRDRERTDGASKRSKCQDFSVRKEV